MLAPKPDFFWGGVLGGHYEVLLGQERAPTLLLQAVIFLDILRVQTSKFMLFDTKTNMFLDFDLQLCDFCQMCVSSNGVHPSNPFLEPQ